MTGPQAAVLTRDLTRAYGARRGSPPVVALDALSLRVEHGEVHGLLGPNGAGKSTLMKLLSTVLLPTSGRAQVCGHDVVTATRAVRPLVGVVFGGERGLYPRLTARQNLRYWSALYGLGSKVAAQRVEDLLDRFDLRSKADSRVETYSAGMRQRLHLARGLIGDPRVLLLDEPTNGLDPVAAVRLRGTIREIAAQGRTVLMATHDMHEAESLCDRVSLIDRGRLLATESPQALSRRICGHERVEVRGADEAALGRIRGLLGVTSLTAVDTGWVRIEVAHRDAVNGVLQEALLSGATSVRTELPSLQEAYLSMVGGAAS